MANPTWQLGIDRAALLMCLVGVCCIASAVEPTGVSSGRSPPLDSDYLLTPAGYYHRSCIHEVESGSVIDTEGRVTFPNGAEFQAAPCEYPPRPLKGLGKDGPEPTLNGWIENSWFYAPGGWFKRLTADWTVPAVPTLTYWDDNQTFFTFPGLERFGPTAIIQPVLQFGRSAAGGGNYWAISSWYCGPSCFHSNIVGVSAGNSLHGTISADCDPDLNCLWNITADSSSGASTRLSLGDFGPAYIWATGGALEVYNLYFCGYLPPNGPTVFSNVSLFDQDGSRLSPNWGTTVNGGTPNCSFGVGTSVDSTALYYSGDCGSCAGAQCGDRDACGRCCGGDCGPTAYCDTFCQCHSGD